MAELTPVQRKVARILALFTAFVAVIMFVLASVDRIDLPLIIPVLLLASAAGILLATRPSPSR